MGWEESMFALFEDLEQQAEGLHLLERDADVAALTAAEYSQVSLRSRLHGSVGRELRLRLLGGRTLEGRATRVGEDWLLLVAGGDEWIVRQAGVCTVEGLSGRADNEQTWSVTDRLTLRSLLRRLSETQERCVLHFVDDHHLEGTIGKVGRDFVELLVGQGAGRRLQVVTLGSLAAVQGRAG